MAKQIAGVYERVLDCAKREFLEKGYTNASLRTIAANADTSTSSIYVRFGDKEGLFTAVVQPAVDGLMAMYMDVQETFHGFDKETQLKEMGSYTESEMDRMVDYMYDNLDAFRLLLDAAYGTKFQNFVDDLVRVEVKYTYKYMEAVGIPFPADMDTDMAQELFHMMTTSYFQGVFEVIRHGKERAEAKRYIRFMGRYHHAGFSAIFYSFQSTLPVRESDNKM